MPVATVSSSIGPAVLADVGMLAYNGVIFSSLYKSKVSGVAVKDNANRTVKYVKWTISVEALVTLPANQTTIDATLMELRERLNEQGGTLTYFGKGLGTDLYVNKVGGKLRDVCWGPVPETLDFQPLGMSSSALVHWTVSFCIPEAEPVSSGKRPVLAFNQESSLSYDEKQYASISIKGTLEIPLSRTAVDARVATDTVDAYRQRFIDVVANGFDLTLLRITRRNFDVSADGRTLSWHIAAEELPPMGLPPGCTMARGSMKVRNYDKGFIVWTATLNASYTVRSDQPQRLAWEAFCSMVSYRMGQSLKGNLPDQKDKSSKGQQPVAKATALGGEIAKEFLLPKLGRDFLNWWQAVDKVQQQQAQQQAQQQGASLVKEYRAWLTNFEIDEGLYQESDRISFSATWTVLTTISHILLATGVWRWQGGTLGGAAYATSMRDILGWKSWLSAEVDPNSDIIVDFGGSGDL